MQAVLLFCVAGVLFSGAIVEGARRCGRNAHYSDYASVCPKNCASKDSDAQCQAFGPGCECNDGFVFLDKQTGPCVKPGRCPSRCGNNAHYSESASACPANCYNKGQAFMCQAVEPGCECNDGYVFENSQKRDCVDPDTCPPPVKQNRAQGPVGRCGRNAHYSESASVCPANCDNYGSAFSCQALAPGCECDNGYIFSGDQNSDCIPPNQCSNTEPPCSCGQNAHYSESASVCPANCNNKGQAFMCQAVAPGCECDSGYVFADDQSSDCVAPSNCPPPVGICGVNEEYSTCVIPCNDCYTRGNCNFLVCNKGCDCKIGYYRDTNGICIPASQCPTDTEPTCGCGQNAHYSESASVCPATCSNRGQAFTCQAVAPGCECDSEYVFLDDQKNSCVEPKDCPPPADDC